MAAKNTSSASIDAENRLVITDILEEKLKKGKGKASYKAHIDKYSGKRYLSKVALDGAWALTPEHDLKFRVSGSQYPYSGKTFIFSGNITHVDGSGLTFRVRNSDALSGIRGTTIELKGQWRADKSNLITFNAAKSTGKYDILRFRGTWQVNKRNEVVYKYTKTVLKTMTKQVKTLIFKGYWDLKKNRITYRFEHSNNSFFEFSASLKSRNLRASQGVIKYDVGIKYQTKIVYRSIKKTVTLYGTWKLSKGLKVGFVLKYSGRTEREVEFLAEKMIGTSTCITVSLKDKNGKNLGIQVSFSRIFDNDAELFLSLGHSAVESRIMGGLRIKF